MDVSNLSFGAILEFFGSVAIIGGGLKIILEATKPFKAIQKHLDETDMKLDNDNKRFKEVDKNYKELKGVINVQNKLLIEIANHLISGNDVEKLKERKNDLVDKLLDK